MTDNKLSELEIKLFNTTIKFLNRIIEEEKYNGALDVVIRKSLESDKYGTYIGIQSGLSETISHNCALKCYESSEKTKICFTPESKERPYDKKYKEFILKEVPECKEVEIIED